LSTIVGSIFGIVMTYRRLKPCTKSFVIFGDRISVKPRSYCSRNYIAKSNRSYSVNVSATNKNIFKHLFPSISVSSDVKMDTEVVYSLTLNPDEIHILRYSFTFMKLVYSHTISRFLSQWHEDYLLAKNGFRLQY
jgi:hypothetical protein